MRFALGLLALLLAAGPASAQSPFYASCMTSAEGGDALPLATAQVLCACAETQAMAAGETTGSIGRYLAFAEGLDADASGLAAMEAPPAWAVRTSEVLVQSVASCVAGAGDRAQVDGPGQPADAAPDAETGGTAATSAPAAAPVLPSGVRTGDGTSPVRTRQTGTGAAIRVVG